MNIFVLDSDPTQAAVQQLDKHVVKMVVETCQLLYTAVRVLNGDDAAPDGIGAYWPGGAAACVSAACSSASWALLI